MDQEEQAKRERNALFRGMNEWRLREQLLMAHDVLEEMLSISFLSGEQKLGSAEREEWEGNLLYRLKSILQAQDTCILCGGRYPVWGYQPGHDCQEGEG